MILTPKCLFAVAVANHHEKLRSFDRLIRNATNNAFTDTVIKQRTPKTKALALHGNSVSCGIAADVATFCRDGRLKEATAIFQEISQQGVSINSETYAHLLQACGDMKFLPEGKQIHAHLLLCGLEPNVFLETKLIIMYANCGSFVDARLMFDKIPIRNVFSWNGLIRGCVTHGHYEESLALYSQMQRASINPDRFTFPFVLKACAGLGTLQQGKNIHTDIIRSGIELNVYVECALIDMYSKCRSMENACRVFDEMSQRNVVSWTAMIAGYAQNGLANEALKVFREMQVAGMKPNLMTITSVLPACTHSVALQLGKEIHDHAIKSGIESDVFVASALIDMYSKCGCVEIARQVFDKITRKDVVSWNAMIVGYGMHGHGIKAIELLNQMEMAGVKPDHVTFIHVLSACSHAGLLIEGLQYFDCMSRYYHITPTVDHYACMVDLLGRVGHLDEAYNFIMKMPLQPDIVVWGTLLSACRIHNNIELGECAFRHLFELEPDNCGNYVLLSNIYAEAGRWDDVANLRTMMKNRGFKKRPGCSWIQVKNRVHAFLVGDMIHEQSAEIYAMLESLAAQLKETGYMPDTKFVMHDVEEEEKEYILCGHSEKLAIAFGLLNTCPGMPILITKNLRVCGDCHIAIKLISKVVGREIFVRDANRFHHFKDGMCSCGDYW
eukprot:Gb_26155 [translate_table: standard]